MRKDTASVAVGLDMGSNVVPGVTRNHPAGGIGGRQARGVLADGRDDTDQKLPGRIQPCEAP
jgi:hypothetical protein